MPSWHMPDIINLRQARKNLARAAADQAASEARIRHGRTKAAKRSDALDAQRREALGAGQLLCGDSQTGAVANRRNESDSTS